ncbi:MAG: S-layer protein, partial [Candidatus Aenigmarchaeota archaeon]|nr:S-layer protein [Candidatus Aenigmarchaeota archaeon]
YEIIAEVDYNNQINERNENNNEMHEKFFVYGGLNCTDSDGGKNYYVKGVCVDSSGRHPDYCAASDRNRKVLQEYYCGSDNKCHLTSYECPGICEDAECVDEEGYCYPGADLGKYPEPFVEDGIADFVAVVGSEAPTSDVVAAIDIAAKLFSETNNPGTQPAAKLDTEITDEDKEKNMILVGTKCKNKMIEELAGSYEAVVGCSEWDLPDGQALIRLVPDVFTKGKMLMVVSGTDENAVRAAATVLKNYDSSEYSDYAKGSSLLVIFEDEENIKIINQCEKCTDSDGGLNYYEKGFTKGRREDTGLYDEVWDYCMQGAIIEHYCENNVLKAKDMTCPSGCEDGACIECLNHGNWTRDLSLDCCDGLEFKSDLWDSSLYTCCHPTECAQDTTCVESGTEFSNWKVKCENGKWVNISTCKDSDSGKNYYVKGECVDGASCSAGKCYDYCSDGKINEFYCSAGNVCKMDTFDCPYGCVDGMCREAPVDLDPPEITEESITPNPGKYNKKFFVEAKITDASNIEYVKLRLTHSTLKKEVILNDKGVNGDKSANDGVYSSYFYFNSPKLVGTWEGKIEASDEHANIGYSKQLSLEVTSICVPIIQNGDPRNTIDIVFVPYGFSDSELEIIWPKKVNDYISMPNGFGNLQHVSILDVEPFASMKDKFNFYRVDEYIPIPRSCRYPSCAVSQAVRASGYCPDTDYRVIVVDKGPGAFGAYGWTYFGGPNIFVSSKPNTGHVIVHEFGHAIGRIPDYWQHSNRHPSCIMALNTKPDCWSCYCSSCRNKMKRGINRARR